MHACSSYCRRKKKKKKTETRDDRRRHPKNDRQEERRRDDTTMLVVTINNATPHSCPVQYSTVHPAAKVPDQGPAVAAAAAVMEVVVGGENPLVGTLFEGGWVGSMETKQPSIFFVRLDTPTDCSNK